MNAFFFNEIAGEVDEVAQPHIGKNMVIYEVSLAIEEAIYSEFQVWLKKHATKMLQFPGFIKASILKPEQSSALKKQLVVQYQLENRKALDVYFEHHAAQMRAEGISVFKDKFSAERKIYEVEEVL